MLSILWSSRFADPSSTLQFSPVIRNGSGSDGWEFSRRFVIFVNIVVTEFNLTERRSVG
jgi:hypothetical protein